LQEFFNGALKTATYERNEFFAGGKEKKAVTEKVTIEVKPGYSEETVLRFKHKGHESWGASASDLIVKFKQEFNS